MSQLRLDFGDEWIAEWLGDLLAEPPQAVDPDPAWRRDEYRRRLETNVERGRQLRRRWATDPHFKRWLHH